VIGVILWILERLRVGPFILERFLRIGGGNAHHLSTRPQSAVSAVFGLLILGGMIGLGVWMVRRRRFMLMRPGPTSRVGVEPAEPRRRLPAMVGLLRRRRELPDQAVRRLYAEALVALEGRGIEKPASATPAEFVALVTAAFPPARSATTALTRAYEDVRYGSLEVTEARAERLRRQQPLLLATIREAPRADQSVETPAGG
jgi:hypothetical protein